MNGHYYVKYKIQFLNLLLKITIIIIFTVSFGGEEKRHKPTKFTTFKLPHMYNKFLINGATQTNLMKRSIKINQGKNYGTQTLVTTVIIVSYKSVEIF